MNTDGAANGAPGLAGSGVIIRNHLGKFVSAFSANFDHCVAMKVEVTTITKGIALAREPKIPKLEIQLDNLTCVQFLSITEVVSGDYVHDIKSCRSMLQEEDNDVEDSSCVS